MASTVLCVALTDLPLATGHGDVDETAGVCDPLLRAALGGLLLLLGLNLHIVLSEPCARLFLVSAGDGGATSGASDSVLPAPPS